MVTADDVRAYAMTLPRTSEHLIYDQVKFRIGRIVYLALSRDETVLGFGFPKEERAALVAAACYSGPGRDHFAVVTAPIPAERQGRLREDVTSVTQLLAHELEGLIRRAPEQWHVLQPRFEGD